MTLGLTKSAKKGRTTTGRTPGILRGVSASYDPTLYELIHRGTPGDVEYYVSKLQGVGQILELGCGYGRILMALAQAYPDAALVGVDRDEGLLARARSRLPARVELLQKDIRNLELSGRRFDAIIAPYSVLWCLERDEDVRACFATVYRHLAPGGRFLFDAYSADGFHAEEAEERAAGSDDSEDSEDSADFIFVAEVYEGDVGYRVFEGSSWRPEKQAFTVRYLYEGTDGSPDKLGVIEHRYLLADQVQSMLRGVGFCEVRLSGGFSEEPFHPEVEQLVVEANVGVER